MMKKIINVISRYYDNDFGWINFLSGIMISSSINTLTGYCTAVNPSMFAFLSFAFTLISSAGLFFLYQTLNRAKHEMESEIESYDCRLSPKDLILHKKTIWATCIDKSRSKLTKWLSLSIWSGFLGLIVFLILSYLDTNQWKIC